MTNTKTIFIGQFRWMGSDDWTNDTVIALSREDAEKAILDTVNESILEDLMDEIRYSTEDVSEEEARETAMASWTPWTSLNRLLDQEPEFQAIVYEAGSLDF